MKLTIDLLDLMSLGPNIWVIPITGGPCSGKSTGMSVLRQRFSDRGYKVIIVPETATEMILAGTAPWDKEISPDEFQEKLILHMLTKEQTYFELARHYRDKGWKVIILCDRGTMDGEAYMQRGQFGKMLKRNGLNVHEICQQRYSAVMCLVTAAIGKRKFYTCVNNQARKETPAEAAALCRRTRKAWTRHHHPRVIDNSTDFERKIDRLFEEICAVIGEPVPLEDEQKFVVDDIDFSRAGPCFRSIICNDYLAGTGEREERRARSRTDKEGATFSFAHKEDVSIGVRIERERIVKEGEYLALLELRDPDAKQVKKERTCFFWEGQFFEADVYPSGLIVLEIERSKASPKLRIPPFVKGERNVTGDKRYSNRAMAYGLGV